jgi:hypothetical protein
MACKFSLKMPDFHVEFRDLLHAVNLRHGTHSFTSLPKKGVLRIFSTWKIRRLRLGLSPRTLVLKTSTLPLDHRSNLTTRCFWFVDCHHIRVYWEGKILPLPSKCAEGSFLINIAFVITISKAQGQTLKRDWIGPTSPGVFSHAQLYVAFSRSSSIWQRRCFIHLRSSTKWESERLTISNITYREVL